MSFLNLSTYVEKYELGKTLEHGTHSKIKITKNLENDSIFAIKNIDKKIIHKHNMVHDIKREISSMNLINYPYVVQLLDFMANKTKIYLVQKYVCGGEFLNKIKIQK